MDTFKSILYVIEEPELEPGTAAARAVSLAENNQASLSVLHVADEPRIGPFTGKIKAEDVKDRVRSQATERIAALLASAGRVADVDIGVRFGVGFVEIICEVLRNRHDLVIKSAGEGGVHSFLFGGTDQHLLRKCPCPVWIMVQNTRVKCHRILAAVDFDPWHESNGAFSVEDELNREIVGTAGSLAASDFAQLHVVHAWQSITDNMIRIFSSDLPERDSAANRDKERREHHARLDLLDSRLREQFGRDVYRYLSPRFHLREGAAREVVPKLAKELEIDLVVMGTVSRTGIPGLLIGNTAEVILNNLECSVLAVKPSGFITPVTLD